MKFKTEMRGDIAIMHIHGDLLGGPKTSEVLPSEMKRLIEEGITKVIVDLEGVKRINSTGLGILIRGYTSLKSKEGDLKLVCMNETIKGILVMTKLESVFDTYRTIEGAVRNF